MSLCEALWPSWDAQSRSSPRHCCSSFCRPVLVAGMLPSATPGGRGLRTKFPSVHMLSQKTQALTSAASHWPEAGHSTATESRKQSIWGWTWSSLSKTEGPLMSQRSRQVAVSAPGWFRGSGHCPRAVSVSVSLHFVLLHVGFPLTQASVCSQERCCYFGSDMHS